MTPPRTDSDAPVAQPTAGSTARSAGWTAAAETPSETKRSGIRSDGGATAPTSFASSSEETVRTAAAQVNAAAAAAPASQLDRAALDRVRRKTVHTLSESVARAHLDKLLFATFLIAGFVAIFVLKKQSHVDAIYVAMGAVAAMLLYVALAWLLPKPRPRPDRLGDNLYYMGFVFTLASMSAALVDLQSGADVGTLIGSFGIALFSTIAGIAGRVLLLQLRTEVEDVEQIVKAQLIASSNDLRDQLALAVNNMESFRLGVAAKVDENFRSYLRQQNDAADQYFAGIQKHFANAAMGLDHRSDQLLERLSEMTHRMSGAATAIGGLASRLNEIDIPKNILDAKLAQIVAGMGAVMRSYQERAGVDEQFRTELMEAAKSMKVIMGDIARQITRMKGQSDTISSLVLPSDRYAQSLGMMQTKVEDLLVRTGAQHDAIDQIGTSLHSQSRLLSAQFAELVEIFAGQKESLIALGEDTEVARRKLVMEMEASEDAIGRAKQAAVQASEVAAAQAARFAAEQMASAAPEVR
jgi:hypothetical protein